VTESQSSTESDPRTRMVNAAIRLLAEDGPEALQVRRVASAVGVSSMVVYSRFGGMPQLVEAVIEEGFRRLGERFTGLARTDDPVADICRVGLTYHMSAWENPHLFDLMFGLSTPGGYRQVTRPRRVAGAEGTAFDQTYRALVDRANWAIEAGRIRRDDPDRMACELWSCVHGFTTLDLGHHFSHLTDPILEVYAPMATNILVGFGDEPQRAARSAADAVRSMART